MKQAEFWLLDCVVETPLCALEWLTAADVEQRLQRRGHGLSLAALEQTLLRLFEQGLLVAQSLLLQPSYRLVGDTFVPTAAQVRAALAGEAHLSYSLTPRGGTRWEQLARPDWNRYVAFVAHGSDIEVIGTDAHLLRHYLTQLPDQHGDTVVPGSEQWDTLVPWEATYWKVLSRAHRVRCHLSRQPGPDAVQHWLQHQPPWYRRQP